MNVGKISQRPARSRSNRKLLCSNRYSRTYLEIFKFRKKQIRLFKIILFAIFIFMNKILFLLFNFLISSNLLFKLLFYVFIFIFYIIYHNDHNIEPFGIFLSCSISFVFFVWIFKVSIFIILSQIKHKDTYITQFFEKIKNERKYKFKVVLYALLSDFLCIFLTPIMYTFIFSNNSSEYINCFLSIIAAFVLWGGGVTLSYLSLIVWFSITQKYNKQ